LFNEVIKHWDCTVLEGKRTLEQQEANVAKGVSKTMDSRHLDDPATAVDVAPFPLAWPKLDALKAMPNDVRDALWNEIKNMARFYYFSGYVLGTADQIGVSIRHGGDWDGDRDIHDQNFDDLPHFELRR